METNRMKKLVGVFVVAAALAVAFSGTPVNAAGATFAPNGGPWCITFDNFCDTLQISTDNSGNNYGGWDWTCVGDHVTASVLGQNAAPATTGTRPVYPGTNQAFVYTANFVWSVGPRTFDLWGTNGASTFQFQNDQGFDFTPGPCLTLNGSLPSSLTR
jgi:hypothetical protein